MGLDRPILQTSNAYKQVDTTTAVSRTIYYGEVIDIADPTGGGNIKVKIPALDNKIGNKDLVWCYPFLPKFFHAPPKVGEYVRVLIEDARYPQRSRFWTGSVISQLPFIGFDPIFTALSTTNMALTAPSPAPSTIPDADGIYPQETDIALIGRVNTDIILRINQISIRAGKHEDGNVLKLNTTNPATIDMIFEQTQDTANFYSNTIIQSDKIAILSHNGNPQFKAARLTPEDRTKIFATAHPMVRGDTLVEALNIIRNAVINHIHGYSNLPADKTAIIKTLESINFDGILQKNVVIN